MDEIGVAAATCASLGAWPCVWDGMCDARDGMFDDAHKGTPSSLSTSRKVVLIGLLAGPIAVMLAAIVAYDADWPTIQAHRDELLLGLIPAAFALVALLAPPRWFRPVALWGGGLLLFLSLIIISAGLFFLPTAVLMILAGRASQRRSSNP